MNRDYQDIEFTDNYITVKCTVDFSYTGEDMVFHKVYVTGFTVEGTEFVTIATLAGKEFIETFKPQIETACREALDKQTGVDVMSVYKSRLEGRYEHY